MKEKIVVHFGGGALGRGLVIPVLIKSGWDVILVDTNQNLINQIKENGNTYILDVTDDTKRYQKMRLYDVINSKEEEVKLNEILKETDIVTTSVRRENLKYIAPTLCKAWENTENNHLVICCENVEDIGKYFKSLLVENGLKYKDLEKVKVPDTIIDRICATDKEMNVISEKFHECSVDKNIVEKTGVRFIDSVNDIKAHFYRKRYLMNTYADLVSFLGKKQGLKYLYEAVKDDSINERIIPYMNLLKKVLNLTYNISFKELNNWQDIYRQRLSNEKIPRDIDTVARNLEVKMGLEERFIAPLINLLELKEDITDGLPIIKELIDCHENKEIMFKKINEMWSKTSKGKQLKELFNSYIAE